MESNKDRLALLVEKWKVILDEGDVKITNPKIRRATALMLENEYKHLEETNPNMQLDEANYTSGSFGTSYATSGEFHKIAIPMVRRTFPELIAHEIVGVQPMNGPVGLAFALRYRAGTTAGNYTAGSTELGYNTIDQNYTGSIVTTAGEALGSKLQSGLGLGIGTGAAIKEVNMTVEKAQVTAATRKLRSRWSSEVAQDLKNMQGLNMEDEMMDILAYEITAEIDRELIGVIQTAATTTSGSSAGFNFTGGGAVDGRWESEKYRNMYNNLLRRAASIAVRTRRGAGNYTVASSNVSAGFETLNTFAVHPAPTSVNLATTGVARVGALDGRITLYRDTFAARDQFLVGYKGPSEWDTGVIYLPYVQLLSSKVMYEDSFQPSIGLMSRYGIHSHIFGAGQYYQYVAVSNLPG